MIMNIRAIAQLDVCMLSIHAIIILDVNIYNNVLYLCCFLYFLFLQHYPAMKFRADHGNNGLPYS